MTYLKPVLAAAVLAAPSVSFAAEWSTRVTGYMNIGVAIADIENQDDGFGVLRDGEAHLRAKLVADNGITFGARVELEAFTASDQIDENYGYVSGSFGTILIGGADTALNEHGGIGVVKPNGSYLNYYDSDGNFLPDEPGGFIGEDDGLGIRYFFNFNGFEAGVSYQPDETVDGGNDTNNPSFKNGASDQWAFGANYTGDFGDFEFAVGGGFLTKDNEDQYHVGVEFAYAGFSAGAFYNREDPDGATPDDVERFGVGAMYATGPWTVGGGYVRQDFMNVDEETDFIHLGVGYKLAPGVKANAVFQYSDDRSGEESNAGVAYLELKF